MFLTKMGVVAIYQIGSVAEPGISDIDLLVVLEDKIKFQDDPIDTCDANERQLFIHSLFAISRSLFKEAQRYTFFHNYVLLRGEELRDDFSPLKLEEVNQLKSQVALEYLIKMFVSTKVEQHYGIVRLRGLLLHVKGLAYDLEFLDEQEGALASLIQQIITWRSVWFTQRPSNNELKDWLASFWGVLEGFLDDQLASQPFYVPKKGVIVLGRHLRLEPATALAVNHRGLSLPSSIGRLDPRLFNLQHRFNRFYFKIPMTEHQMPSVINDYFSFQLKAETDRSNHYPHFLRLATSLKLI